MPCKICLKLAAKVDVAIYKVVTGLKLKSHPDNVVRTLEAQAKRFKDWPNNPYKKLLKDIRRKNNGRTQT